MQKGVNKVTIVGNLGQDPEMRAFPNGTPIAILNVATSEVWKDKETGQQTEETEWHRVILKGRLAEIAREYLRKSSKVYLEGRNKTRKYQGDHGVEMRITEVICHEMQMLDSRSQAAAADQQQNQQTAIQNKPASNTRASNRRQQAGQPVTNGESQGLPI